MSHDFFRFSPDVSIVESDECASPSRRENLANVGDVAWTLECSGGVSQRRRVVRERSFTAFHAAKRGKRYAGVMDDHRFVGNDAWGNRSPKC